MAELPNWWWLAPIGAVASLLTAAWLYRSTVNEKSADGEAITIAAAIREGAMAYLSRQYTVVGLAFLCIAGLLALAAVFGLQHPLVPLGVLMAGLGSACSGFIGMSIATRAAVRVVEAVKVSIGDGLVLAVRGGAVMGLTVVGFALLDISFWFGLIGQLYGESLGGIKQLTAIMLGFSLGASTQALFARVGGGIYTKSADVGADLVGKTEANLPEDDPRNPAVIADNVGDNVGDVAGMGADLYESYYSSLLASAALGPAAAIAMGYFDATVLLAFAAAPMALAGIGNVLSIIGVYLVRGKGAQENVGALLNSLRFAIWGVTGLTAVCSFFLFQIAFPEAVWMGFWLSVVVGLAVGLLIGAFSEYFTSSAYYPTQWVAEQAQTGYGTAIIGGVAQGMLSAWPALAVVASGVLLAFMAAGGATAPAAGVYGIGLAAVGMLAPLGLTLATDAYGSIADNAGGIAEMSHQESSVRERTDILDALGNTTAATGKGFAIGSAALTALALLVGVVEQSRTSLSQSVAATEAGTNYEKRAFGIEVEGETVVHIPSVTGEVYLISEQEIRQATPEDRARVILGESETERLISLVAVEKAPLNDLLNYFEVQMLRPQVLSGMLIGSLAVFVFAGLTIKAVGRAAGQMVAEVRRQFQEYNLLTDPNARPDYAGCVRIATAAAQREMVVPALLAISIPIAVGLLLGMPGVIGMLTAALVTGFGVAVFMANSGGSWDNAKKFIEAGNFGGKGSEAHKAAVVGDTVGDPFKDTAGPSLNILIKLMSIVSVVAAGLTVNYGGWLG